jgi:hypothetical protein
MITARVIRTMSDTVGPYDAKAGILAARYETKPTSRVEGRRRHPDLRIRWLEDRLPDLTGVKSSGCHKPRQLCGALPIVRATPHIKPS